MNKQVVGSLLLAVSIAISVSACNLQPAYTRPVAPVAANWGDGAASPGAPAAPQLPWRAVFHDDKLQKIISLALVQNRDLRVAALNVEKARAQYRIQRADLAPSVSLGASDTAAHVPGGLYTTQTTGAATYHQYDANLGITSYEVDLFGRVRSLNAAALQSFLSEAETRRSVQISLISQVASSYLTLCSDTDLLQLANDTVASETQSYNLVKMQYDADVATAQDLAQAETAVRSAEADVATYKRQAARDISELNLLVGAPIPADLLSDTHLADETSIPRVSAGLSSDVLYARPDVLAAEATLKSANADIGAARAAFFPSISLTASGGSSSGSLGKLFDAGTGAWTFMPSINLPIFTGGRNRAQLDEAKVSQQIEVANYEKTIQTAFREVADALSGVTTYADELAAREKDAAANDTNLRLAKMRFDQGVEDYLDVLVAQRLQYAARQSLISARLGLLNQRATLYKVLGGGWSGDEGPAVAQQAE